MTTIAGIFKDSSLIGEANSAAHTRLAEAENLGQVDGRSCRSAAGKDHAQSSEISEGVYSCLCPCSEGGAVELNRN